MSLGGGAIKILERLRARFPRVEVLRSYVSGCSLIEVPCPFYPPIKQTSSKSIFSPFRHKLLELATIWVHAIKVGSNDFCNHSQLYVSSCHYQQYTLWGCWKKWVLSCGKLSLLKEA